MNEMLRKRMSATQQASEQQTGDAAYEQIFQMPVPQTETQFRDVPISKLRPFFTADIGFHPYPRAKLEAFAEELKENGLYERILVRPIAGTDEFEILAGHNRTEAAKLAGWADIPATVMTVNDQRAISIAIATNLLRRQDLTIIERGKAYDWTGSNRNNRYFYDLYGVYSDAPTAGGTMSASDVSVQSTGTIIGNCPSCGKYSFQGVYVEVAHSSRGHANYNECNACHYVQYLGTYTTKSRGSGAYGSGTCPDCGSHTWVLQSQQAATCTSNGYRSYSCACGQTKSETIYAGGHSYSYGSWEQYSSSQHRRTGTCRNCGATDYDYASHSMSYGAWSNSSSSQHSRTATCRTCGYSTTEYGSHSYSTGSWSKYSDTQHRRSKTCSGCGASTYDYADHSYSYGSWVSDNEVRHKRTKTCSACGDSGYEYADHTDTNGDGKCDDCGATVSLAVTWDAGSNGGTIDGKAAYSETVQPNSKPTIPASLPVKKGHSFKGWYTAKTGGKLYNTVTSITASTTFYAQFTANAYTVTWNLGTGQSETTQQTYGEKLVLPTEPTRKNAVFLGWFTEANGGTQVTGNDIFMETADKTYYAHWEITEVFSVTVPVTLPLVVDESGEVHVGTAEIINGSTGEVVVSSVSISTRNGWQIVPYTTDMAHEKVDAQLLGFKINDAQTSKTGNVETFALSAPWEIAENGRLPISYDAVVSAVSKAVTEQEVLSIVFVLEWGGE